MHLPRAIWSDVQTLTSGEIASLGGEEFHHLVKVRRIERNKQIEIFHLKDQIFFLAKILEIKKTNLTFEVIKILDKEPLRPVTLLCGLPDLKVADRIIEKCGEIGLSRIGFFFADRSQGFSKKKIDDRRVERWQNIATSAFKQSLQTRILDLDLYENLDLCLECIDSPSVDRWVFHPDLEGKLRSINFFSIQNQPLQADSHKNKPSNIKALSSPIPENKIPLENTIPNAETLIVVGPEGGLSDREFKLLKSKKFRHANLGRGILRVETAAVLASGIAILGK